MEASKQLEETRYITSITPMSQHEEYNDLDLPMATPVVSLKASTRSELKKGEQVVYAKSRTSAWARALRIARKLSTPSMGVHKHHAIRIIQIYNHD